MFRSQRGYTQARIAEKLKISRSTYANYESGNRSPDLEMLSGRQGKCPAEERESSRSECRIFVFCGNKDQQK